jgi:hypothetical protein
MTIDLWSWQPGADLTTGPLRPEWPRPILSGTFARLRRLGCPGGISFLNGGRERMKLSPSGSIPKAENELAWRGAATLGYENSELAQLVRSSSRATYSAAGADAPYGHAARRPQQLGAWRYRLLELAGQGAELWCPELRYLPLRESRVGFSATYGIVGPTQAT